VCLPFDSFASKGVAGRGKLVQSDIFIFKPLFQGGERLAFGHTEGPLALQFGTGVVKFRKVAIKPL